MRMAHQHRCQPLQFFRRIGCAGRIGRRVQDQPLGPGRDCRLQHLGHELEAGRGISHRKYRLCATEPHDLRIAHPVRHGHHHLVAGIERRQQRVENDLLAARADKAIGRRHIEPVIAPELGCHRFLELGNAVNIGVARLALVHGTLGRVAHILRRVEIRFAGGKRDDVATLLCHDPGFLADRHGCRRRHARQCFRQKPHVTSPRNALSHLCANGNARAFSLRPKPAEEKTRHSSALKWPAHLRLRLTVRPHCGGFLLCIEVEYRPPCKNL